MDFSILPSLNSRFSELPFSSICRFLDSWVPGFLGSKISRFADSPNFGFLDSCTPACPGSWIQRPLVSEIPRLQNNSIPRCLDPSVPGFRVSFVHPLPYPWILRFLDFWAARFLGCPLAVSSKAPNLRSLDFSIRRILGYRNRGFFVFRSSGFFGFPIRGCADS